MKKLFLLSVILVGNFSAAIAGGLVTNTNHSAAFLRNPARDATTDLIMSSYSVGGGLKYNVSSNLTLNLGVLWTHFNDYSKTASYNGIGMLELYERKSIAVALGANWSF